MNKSKAALVDQSNLKDQRCMIATALMPYFLESGSENPLPDRVKTAATGAVCAADILLYQLERTESV